MNKPQAHKQTKSNSQTKKSNKRQSKKGEVININAYFKIKEYFNVYDYISETQSELENTFESQMIQLQKQSKKVEGESIQSFQIKEIIPPNLKSQEIMIQQVLNFSPIHQLKSANLSDCNSNSNYDFEKISIKKLLGDPKYATFGNEDIVQVQPEEREFYDILLAQYKYLPTKQSFHKNEDVRLFITKVANLQNDTIKLNELLNSCKEFIKQNVNSQTQDELEVLQLQKDALEKYLEIQFKKLILKVDSKIKIDDQCLKETIQSFQNTNGIPINTINSNNFQFNSNKEKPKTQHSETANSFVTLNPKQLMTIKLNQDLQIDFYNQKYNIDQNDTFFTSSTTSDINFQEIGLLNRKLREFFSHKKSQDLQMLNIPSGNGRLNSTFSDYFWTIDCVDPCEKANIMVSNQKDNANFKDKIGNISKLTIQNWSLDSNSKKLYNLIWCNYGFSYLNGKDAISFLENASNSLHYDGYLIIKDVIVEDKCCAIYFKDEERVFRALDQYNETFQKFFHIVNFEQFVPKSQGGYSFRPEGIFILQKFQRKNKKNQNQIHKQLNK